MSVPFDALERIKGTKAIVADGDRTLWRGNVAESLGKMYLKREWRAFQLTDPSTYYHLRTLNSGLSSYRKVKKVERENETSGEGVGLQIFYGALIRNGLGNRIEMIEHARAFFESHETETVSLFT